ncbi:MAG: thioredoxin [Candidatus Shikimatogenerans bostrichidophilus]|nr:MAG: thioredoxin [Candidatus Shikimatogenerans bostrichidophilus]
MNKIKTLKIYKNNKNTIIDFWANWCAPCIYLNPILEEIKKKYEKKIFIYKINIDKEKKISKFYNVISIPTIIFLKYGKEINRHIGLINKKKFIELCNKLINY